MEVTFLGAHNCVSDATANLSLLVDGRLALDAGNLAGGLGLEAQSRLEAVLLTHQHYDHVRDIPALGMNLFLSGAALDIYSLAETAAVVQGHLLDGAMYPDFRHRPGEKPVFRWHTLRPLDTVSVAGCRVRPLKVPHSVPAAGYEVVAADGACLFYTGDTGPGLEDCWRQVAPDLLVIEITASDRYLEAMRERRHLTPSLLRAEMVSFREIHGYVPRVVVAHMSPPLEDEIAAEVARLAAELSADIRLAGEGMTLQVSPRRES